MGCVSSGHLLLQLGIEPIQLLRWFSKIRCIGVLGSARTGTGSATGLRRRRRFLILAIGSGAAFGCFFTCRFRLGIALEGYR
jgi:hypothetical protein